MKSLCYVLAINVVLTAANTLKATNSSNESQVQSGKVTHTISRIFSIPKNQARTAHNDKYYNQLMKILTGDFGGESTMEASETNRALADSSSILLKNTISGKDVHPESKLQDETRKEIKDNISLSNLRTNTNVKTESTVVNVAGTEKTELNAGAIHEIMQNLKASNVSNLDSTQFRKGKLVIYYGENDASRENPTSETADTSELNIEKIIRIEEAIHNLFTQHEVPETIYLAIKRRKHFDAKDRIKNLITAFVTFKAYKGQLNSDIINKLKVFIADNDIDIDIVKLLLMTDSIDLNEDKTASTVDVNVMKNSLNYSDVAKTEKSLHMTDVTTILNSAIINDIERDINPEKSVEKSLSTLRDIVLSPQEVVTTKDSSLGTSNLLIPTATHSKLNEDSVNSSTTYNQNDPKVPKHGYDGKYQIVLDNSRFNLPVSGLQDVNNILFSEDILNQIRTQLKQGNRTKNDFENLKNILIGTIRSTFLQQIDPNVPVFSNIPVEEYVNYKNKNPLLIYVIFPESDKSIKSDSELETSGEFDVNSILQLIKVEIENQKKVRNIKETNQQNVNLDIISEITDHNNKIQFENSEKDVIEEIISNLYDRQESKKELSTEGVPDTHETITQKPVTTDQVKNEIDIIKELLILFPNFNNPSYNPAREGDHKNFIEILKELLLNSKYLTQNQHDTNTTPNKPENENAQNDNSLKTILQIILNDKSVEDREFTSEQLRIYKLTEELIARMKYLQRELERLNIPQQIQRNLIEKEIRKVVLKITTDSVASCVERANKSIQLGIQKVLSWRLK